MLNDATLQGAMMTLQDDVRPDVDPPNPSPEYRVGLAQSYLYRVKK